MPSCPAPPGDLRTKPNRLCAAVRVRRRPAWLLYFALPIIAVGVALAAMPGPGFSTSVTPGLVARYAARFGPGARTRIAEWQQFIRSVAAKQGEHPGNDLELLGAVNAFFNRLPYATDQSHWLIDGYWATPAEMVASDGGDCVDFTVAKYFALKELGVPIERLRMTYVKAVNLNQAHMVLAYYPQPNAVPLILDNLINEVKPATERPDLIPVYSFNDEDLMVSVKDERNRSAGSSSQIRMWRDLLDKLKRELKY